MRPITANKHALFRAGILLILFCLSSRVAALGPELGDKVVISGLSSGITATVRSSGQFIVKTESYIWPFVWTFSGRIGQPLYNITKNAGRDTVGDYQEIEFDYFEKVLKQGSIRVYSEKPLVLFSARYLGATDNTETSAFPILTGYPRSPWQLSYNGPFGIYNFDGVGPDSPRIFFNSDANTFIISPALNFMTANVTTGGNSKIISGIDPKIPTLPESFSHRTLLVIGKGINKTIKTWGQALTDLQGKNRLPNDAGVILERFGYWTDNGAFYYYNFEQGLENTLLAVANGFRNLGLVPGYFQLDSWYYPKGPQARWDDMSGGMFKFTAHPDLFPGGLKDFWQKLESRLGSSVFLVAHARWMDEASPYRGLYEVSGGVATDLLYWRFIAEYLKDAGVATYEQDWLSSKAQTALNLYGPGKFLGNMAQAMAEKGITIQYCTPLPRHFLQSSLYGNVTTIRVGQDRFGESRWNEVLYGSLFAGALGLWPWVDVFMSSETGNLLLATLSAGPVGVGDPIGSLSKENLLRAVRKDGVIVKPDVPIVPTDKSIINYAQGQNQPMVAYTFTDFGGIKTVYVFAYPRGEERAVTFKPSEFELSGPVYVYDYFSGDNKVVDSEKEYSSSITGGYAYYIVVPIGNSGIAFLGDAGQFVSLGKKRIAHVTDNGGRIEATIIFAQGEDSRIIYGYSPFPPTIRMLRGKIGRFVYSSEIQLFYAEIFGDSSGTAVVSIGQGN